ncbi:hypothetical protein H5410_017600, partial [Solanum commersonii]
NNTYVGSLNVQGSVNDENALASVRVNQPDFVSKILKEVPGNDKCSDCGASKPDWASLNLGILICVECLGIHQNLGVHISKMSGFESLPSWIYFVHWVILIVTRCGRSCFNFQVTDLILTNVDAIQSASKPSPKDAFHEKEKYILA